MDSADRRLEGLCVQAYQLRAKLHRAGKNEADTLQAELDAVENAILWEDAIVIPLRRTRSFVAACFAQLVHAVAGPGPVGKAKEE